MDEKAREGNYYSLSNLASQSIIMFFLAIFVSCRADLWSKLEEAQDVFLLQRRMQMKPNSKIYPQTN